MEYMSKIQCAICSETEDCSIMYVTRELKLAVHQDCLLYSSGFVEAEGHTTENPDTRFYVPSVKKEVKRGRRLTCHFCHNKGATVGCENPRCHKSYHYFCALKDSAAKDEKPGSYRVYCQKHDPMRRPSLKARVAFLRKWKQAGLLDGIFKEMADTLHLAQEKLKEKLDDDNTPGTDYKEMVTSLFDCSLFENILANAHSGTEEKIQELLETRKRLDTELAAVDTQLELLQRLKAGRPAPENPSDSTSE